MTVYMSFVPKYYGRGCRVDHCFFEEVEAAWFAGMNPNVIIMVLEAM